MRKILTAILMLLLPLAAHANLVDALDLSPFVPLVLDTLVTVAMSAYAFFVGAGDGIIFLLIYIWLGITIVLYLVKMYLPKTWMPVLGLGADGDQVGTGKSAGLNLGYSLLKPIVRGLVACAVLLPLNPKLMTRVLVDPFLQFGAIYTHSISDAVAQQSRFGTAPKKTCPETILSNDYMSKSSCEFLVQPMADIAHVNNRMVERGFGYFTSGLKKLMVFFVSGGSGFMDVITGLLIIVTFVSANFFMALLIIQGIFNFGVALLMYPFGVLGWVATASDKWFDPWPPFSGIITALKNLVITMIACMFMLAINIAVIGALFNWNNNVYSVAAGGSSYSNLPTATSAGFGQHSILWLSSILTLYLMYRIFNLTREKIMEYTDVKPTLHKQVTGDTSALYKNVRGQIKSYQDWKKRVSK